MDASAKLVALLTKQGKAVKDEDGKVVCTICGHSLSKAIEAIIVPAGTDNAEDLIAELGHRCDYTRGETRIPILASVAEGFIPIKDFFDMVVGADTGETPRRVLHRLLGRSRYYVEDRAPALKEVRIVKVKSKIYIHQEDIGVCTAAVLADKEPKVKPGSPAASKKAQ